MGAANKLVASFEGKPLVTHAVDAALASRASPVLVVTGHRADEVRQALAGRPVLFLRNPDSEAGLSSSLATGIGALGPGFDGAVVCLGDMPRVGAHHINALIDAFDQSEPRQICVPVYEERRGNPVLWPQRRFEDLQHLTGDVGGRKLFEASDESVRTVSMADDGALTDVDTLDDLQALQRAFR